MKSITSFIASIIITLGIIPSFGQVSSTNGNFTATTPSNLSLQTGATPTTRLTILNSNGNVGIGTASPADLFHVNGLIRGNQFNTTSGVLNTVGAATNLSFNTNGTNRMTLLSGGNFGIGTAAPADLLHVNGNARATQFGSVNGTYNTIGATNLSLSTNGSSRMTVLNSNGFVGIGTAAPTQRLEVAGAMYVNSSVASTSLNSAEGLFFRNSAATNSTGLWKLGIGTPGNYDDYFVGYNPAGFRWLIVYPSGEAVFTAGAKIAEDALFSPNQHNNSFLKFNSADKSIDLQAWQTGIKLKVNSVEVARVTPTGLGIGTTTPSQALDVNGYLKVGMNVDQFLVRPNSQAIGYSETFLQGQTTGITLFANPASTGYTTTSGVAINANEVGIAGNGNSATVPFIISAPMDLRLRNNGVETMRIISATGNVGIGTTTPAYKLDVAGTINATNILVNGQPISGGGTSQWVTSGSDISYTTGNVGIGTPASTAYKLNIVGNLNSSGTLSVGNASGSIPSFFSTLISHASDPDVTFNQSSAAPNERLWQILATAGSFRIITEADDYSAIQDVFKVSRSGVNVTNVLFPNGNVGIGTSAPDAKLTVKGNIHTNEVKVDLLGAVAPDYVFEKDYPLMSLEETKAYIDANKHLPEVPSAKEMEKNGVQLGEMNMLLLKKIEELTLYLLKMNEENKQLKIEQEKQNEAIEFLKSKIK